jgi:Na+(H+)/acetate symporter ActP
MDLRKILITSLVGLIASFVVGFVFYFLYYQDQLAMLTEQFPGVINEEPDFGIGVFVNFAMVFLVAMYFDKANVNNAKSGAINGAWISAVVWIVANGNMMAITKLTTMNYFMVDILISAVMGAVIGIIMALVMNRLSK